MFQRQRPFQANGMAPFGPFPLDCRAARRLLGTATFCPAGFVCAGTLLKGVSGMHVESAR
jgi:hypothetical protein